MSFLEQISFVPVIAKKDGKRPVMPIDYSKWDGFGAEDEEEETFAGKTKALNFLKSDKGKALSNALGAVADAEDPALWSRGLTRDEQYAWLCDCYGLRVVDRSKRGQFVGILAKDATVETVCRDFLVFCRLAMQSMTVPKKWNWHKFLLASLDEIRFPVETTDSKFQNENSPLEGGRSMRLTATAIYVAAAGDPCPLEDSVQKYCQHAFTPKENGDFLYKPLGGRAIWHDFYARFKEDPGPNVRGGSVLKPGEGEDLPADDDSDDATILTIESDDTKAKKRT